MGFRFAYWHESLSIVILFSRVYVSSKFVTTTNQCINIKKIKYRCASFDEHLSTNRLTDFEIHPQEIEVLVHILRHLKLCCGILKKVGNLLS